MNNIVKDILKQVDDKYWNWSMVNIDLGNSKEMFHKPRLKLVRASYYKWKSADLIMDELKQMLKERGCKK